MPFPEIFRRQREYLSGEIGLSAKASGKEQWKTAHHMRQKLIASGYLHANFNAGQVLNVFLTRLGEATARALVGDRLKTFHDMEPHLIFELLRRFDGNSVRESRLFNQPCSGYPSEWADYSEMVLPLLTEGVVSATSDTVGRVLYRLTGKPVPSDTPKVEILSDPEYDDEYIRVYDSERSSLSTAEPRDPHELFIPIPASVCWTDDDPAVIATKAQAETQSES